MQLWKYFDNSAKRAAACQSCYEPEEGPSQNKKGNEKAQKKVASVHVESQSGLEKIHSSTRVSIKTIFKMAENTVSRVQVSNVLQGSMFQGSPAPPSKLVPHLDITVYFFPTATYSIS